MELFIFARFHAKDGEEASVCKALEDQMAFARNEPGCLDIHFYRATRDRRQFFIFSRWRDEAAFEVHAELPHTRDFIAQTEKLIDHPFDATRSHIVA